MGPGQKARDLSKLVSVDFGIPLPLSSHKLMLTARHNSSVMLDMNEDVDISTENTVVWKRKILAFFLIVENSVPLIINPKRSLTPWYHSEKWKDKREEQGTATLRCSTRHHCRSLRNESCGSFTCPANSTFLKPDLKHRCWHA